MSVTSTPTRELQVASEPVVAAPPHPLEGDHAPARPHLQPDAVVRDLRRTRQRILASGIVVGLIATWAIWPQSHEVKPVAIAELARPTNTVTALDLNAFDAPMWTLAALPPPPPPPPAPPPALVEQLLAVSLADASAPIAMFYRPSEDRIVTVHVGESIGGRTIKAIAVDKVTLVWKAGTKTEVVESLFTDPRNGPGAPTTPIAPGGSP